MMWCATSRVPTGGSKPPTKIFFFVIKDGVEDDGKQARIEIPQKNRVVLQKGRQEKRLLRMCPSAGPRSSAAPSSTRAHRRRALQSACWGHACEPNLQQGFAKHFEFFLMLPLEQDERERPLVLRMGYILDILELRGLVASRPMVV